MKKYILIALIAVLILVSIGQYYAHAKIAANGNPPKNITEGPIISFNFDDGWLSAYENALPIFDKAEFKTTQYITTGYLGEKNFITKEQVIAMYKNGHEIGAHTRTHPHLNSLTLENIYDEVAGSKEDLQMLGMHPTTFAYPYGAVNNTVIGIVKDQGFIGARVTKPGFNDKNTDKFQLFYMQVWSKSNFDDIKNAIDTVEKNKKWLIFLFHKVDEDEVKNPESVSHELVQKIVDYVKSKKIPVVTNEEGLKIIQNIN